MNHILFKKIACVTIFTMWMLPMALLLILLPWVTIAAVNGTLNDQLIEAAACGNTVLVKDLLDEGSDVNAKLDNGLTALGTAALSGHREVVELLKTRGAEMTLAIACILGDNPEIQRLLDSGADVNSLDPDGKTPLMQAARAGNVDVVKLLLDSHADVAAKGQHGWTALMHAARAGSTQTLKFLLDNGADINAKDDYGKTALMWTVEIGHIDGARLLLQRGADSNVKEPDGWTVLRTAAIREDTGMARLLVEYGAEEPLCVAAMLGDEKQAGRLIEAGAEIDSIDFDGRTPLMHAARTGNLEVAKLLLEKGAKVNATDAGGGTALMDAVSREHSAIAELLLSNGSDPNLGHQIGWTALTIAVHSRQVDLVRLLLDRGANPNAGRDKYGFTALMDAVDGRQSAVSTMLLDHGADLNAKSDNGWTALTLAALTEQEDIVQKLLNKGAAAKSEYWKRRKSLVLSTKNSGEIKHRVATGISLRRPLGGTRFAAHGMALLPKVSDQAITVDSQGVMIRLGKESYSADCVFRLSNTGETTKKRIGIPRRWTKAEDFIRLDVWADGRKVDASEDHGIVTENRSHPNKCEWRGPLFGLDVKVSAHGQTTIRVRYETDYSYYVPTLYPSKFAWIAEYEFSDSCWGRSVEKLEFTVDSTEVGGHQGFDLQFNPGLIYLPSLITKNTLRYSIIALRPVDTWLKLKLNKPQ